MSSHDLKSARWQKEIAFFDADACEAAETVRPIDPLTLARYRRRSRRRRFNKEFRLHLLGDISGKCILDVGCGSGGNAVLLAALGANVTGIDISPKSIELARRRAEISGVGERVELTCSPLETADIPEQAFDVIWGDSILHHVVENLDSVLAKLVALAKPGALLVFNEPVNLNHLLRRIRLALPIRADAATPDERPLEQPEIAIMRRHIPGLDVRFFDLFGRFNRFVLQSHNYERSPRMRRVVSDTLTSADWVLLSIPGLKNLAAQAVFWGTVDRTHATAQPQRLN